MARVALVTGAARGIGAASVRTLAAAGWHVVAVDRCADDPRIPYPLATEAELRALTRDLGEERVEPVIADVCDAEALTAAVRRADDRFGGIDALVACAGVIAGGSPLWELEPGQERAVIDVDLFGVLSAARVCVPALLRRPEPRSGRVIAIASAAAARGLPLLAAYCAAKAGVASLIRALAVELRGTGITANAISPGSTETAMLDQSARLYGLESAAAFALQQPIERLLAPEEVAEMVLWLAGEKSSGVTGAVIPVDGGLSL